MYHVIVNILKSTGSSDIVRNHNLIVQTVASLHRVAGQPHCCQVKDATKEQEECGGMAVEGKPHPYQEGLGYEYK